MTERDIINELRCQMDLQKIPFMMSNAFVYSWECDFWTLDSNGLTREYEIKISLSDYKVDLKKEKHQNEHLKGANYFYYVCPEKVIAPDIVDKKYGLIYVGQSGSMETIKKPKRLHNNNFCNYKILAEKYSHKYYSLWLKEYMQSNKMTRDEFRKGMDLSEL